MMTTAVHRQLNTRDAINGTFSFFGYMLTGPQLVVYQAYKFQTHTDLLRRLHLQESMKLYRRVADTRAREPSLRTITESLRERDSKRTNKKI